MKTMSFKFLVVTSAMALSLVACGKKSNHANAPGDGNYLNGTCGSSVVGAYQTATNVCDNGGNCEVVYQNFLQSYPNINCSYYANSNSGGTYMVPLRYRTLERRMYAYRDRHVERRHTRSHRRQAEYYPR